VIRIVRLGTPRAAGEGLRVGTVRRPPRGVPKSQFASGNWYDVWYPNLAPSAAAVAAGLSAKTNRQWRAFGKRYRSEMAQPENRHTIELLAALSLHANFSVGCYCEDEARCHRSILRELLREHGAAIRSSEAVESRAQWRPTRQADRKFRLRLRRRS
jgi:uncharacterized protein YeaO (DUF488 family)